METTYTKSAYTSWAGKTWLEIPEIPDRTDMGRFVKPVLSVRTARRSNGLVTSFASVEWHGEGWAISAQFGDFGKHYNATKCARVTEKAIRELHEKTLSQIDTIRAEATAQYLNNSGQEA